MIRIDVAWVDFGSTRSQHYFPKGKIKESEVESVYS